MNNTNKHTNQAGDQQHNCCEKCLHLFVPFDKQQNAKKQNTIKTIYTQKRHMHTPKKTNLVSQTLNSNKWTSPKSPPPPPISEKKGAHPPWWARGTRPAAVQWQPAPGGLPGGWHGSATWQHSASPCHSRPPCAVSPWPVAAPGHCTPSNSMCLQTTLNIKRMLSTVIKDASTKFRTFYWIFCQ